MGAPLKNPTQAEQDFLREFALLLDKAPGDAAERQAAFDRFARAGLPSRRVESWHYSDLRVKLRQASPLAEPPDHVSLDYARAELEKVAAPGALKLVSIDGFFAPDLSDDFSRVAGVEIRPLAALSNDRATLALQADDPLLDLNGAFSPGGLTIEIAAGISLEKPIEIVALCGANGGRSRFSRVHVVLGEGARASLIETRAEGFGGFGDSALLLSLGKAAELDYACRSRDSATVDVQTCVVSLEAGARLCATALVAGAAFLRRQLFVTCAGEKAELHLSAASMLTGQEHADITLVVTHQAPACLSRETFKFVLAEQAEGVFQGKIVVPPQAQKTDGKMVCRGLLLSDDASLQAKPELEIFADDVACGHGAACGKLDANQLFYMESRGIPRPEAQAILIQAFAAEAFDILRDESLRDLLNADLAALLQTGAFA
ncbi:SufD family Fe-S cluster assembly protein [uncultured Rhodoblastus sp.]|uniref:SufB/SufD family protein n=1 Tax=uncultured Rhodoblastus sp. TaxID=543037 RepID=UPI0025FB1ED1|nr:SufD family Fe-S cluster assembly protein [uncultured Rhodoblastus sp.]